MTRARWVTGGVIGAAALIVSGEAFATYVAERLVVGIVAVVVLMAVMAIGFASLARARRYVAREIAALSAEPPSGALYEGRRAQLGALRRRGVSPDLDLLAEATAAAEAERGYTGKYLVATTVLIGLVGTFGGLMETLGRVAPLLKGDLSSSGGGGAFALIAGPLAGLHVTFGTSVVAILVTLALALIQGDVTLHHERLLASLQERTRHVLVPELWPADDSAAERTVRALLDLRAFVAESLTTSSAKSAEKIAGVVRVEVQRLVAQIGAETQAATAAQAAALERSGTVLTEGFRRTTEAAAQVLRDAATASSESFRRTAEAASQALREAATTSTEGFARTTEAAAEALRDAASASRETAKVASQALRDAATASRQTMVEAVSSSREAIATAASAAKEAVSLAAAASRDAFASAAAEAREQVATALETLASATGRAAESISTSTTTALEAVASATGRASESLSTSAASALEAVVSATGRASEAISTSTATAVTSLGELRAGLGAQLEGASQALAASAAELRGSALALAPALAELAPQLGALTAEVALLAARADSPELPNAVLDELVRLAEDVERLVAATQPAVAPAALASTEVAAIEVATEAES